MKCSDVALIDNATAVYTITNEIKICDKLSSANVVGQLLNRVAGTTGDTCSTVKATQKETVKECCYHKNLA